MAITTEMLTSLTKGNFRRVKNDFVSSHPGNALVERSGVPNGKHMEASSTLQGALMNADQAAGFIGTGSPVM